MSNSEESSSSVSSKVVSNESNIAFASVAIIEMITQYLSGFDVMALWCTCSKAMQLRLARGGVREFVISYTASARWSANFYTVLKTMPYLHTVRMQQSSLPVWQAGPKLFESFPPTLRHIIFCLPMRLGEWLLINTVPYTAKRSAVQARAATQKKRITLNTKVFSVDIPSFDMAARFPYLETLNISGGMSYKAGSYTTTNTELFSAETTEKAKLAFARSLPPTMISISLPELGDATWPMIKAMPTSLQNIEIVCSRTKISEFSFASLPPQLTSADLNLVECDWEHEVPYLNRLPQSLQRLEVLISANASNYVFSDLQDHPMSHLSLSLFQLHHRLEFTLSDLPRQLEHCEISVRNTTINSFLAFNLLPRTLHTLKLHSIRFTLADFGSWPEGGFQCLPPMLTRLEIFFGVPVTDADIAFLPRTITHLHLGIWEKSYEAHTCKYYCDSMCRDETKVAAGALTDQCASFLPSDLVTLKLDESYFGADFLRNLPASLKTLDFENKKFLLPSESFDLLPETLTTLDLNVKFASGSFEHLPATLTRLTVRNGELYDCSSLSMLPQALRYLEIRENSTFNDSNAKWLPRQLLELHMPQAGQLTCAALKDIPRGLQTLVVAKIIVPHPRPTKAEILTQLPQLVQAYELPWMQRNGKKIDLSTMS